MAVTYSVTAAMPASLATAWIVWMHNTHVPAVLATGCFTSYSLQQVIDPVSEDDSVLINCSYSCPDATTLARYRTQLSPALQQDAHAWLLQRGMQDQVHFFRSVLQAV